MGHTGDEAGVNISRKIRAQQWLEQRTCFCSLLTFYVTYSTIKHLESFCKELLSYLAPTVGCFLFACFIKEVIPSSLLHKQCDAN